MNIHARIPALVISFALLPVCAAGPSEKSGQREKAPSGYVLLEEEVVYDLPENYPDQAMQSAKKQIEKKRPQEAVKEIRKANAYLKGQESRAGIKGGKALQASIAELEKIIADLEAGASISKKELSQAFARAHLALASNEQEKAAQYHDAGEFHKVGLELKAGVNHVYRAAEWSGSKLEQGTKTALKDALHLSGLAVRGVGFVPEEVGKGIQGLGREIDHLGRKMAGEKEVAEGKEADE